MENLLIIFIVVTALAVVIQMGILLGIFFAVKRSASRFEAIASDLQVKIAPIIETSRDLAADLSPKVKIIGANMADASTTIKSQAEHLNMIVTDVTQRTHAKFIRMDNTITTVLDTVEKTSEAVQHKVMSPVRQINGIMQAASAAIGTLFHKNKRGPGKSEDDDLFI